MPRTSSPQLFELQGDSNGADISIKTTVAGGNVTTEQTKATPITHPVNGQAVLHANGIVGSCVALARLEQTAPGSEVRICVVPEMEIGVRLVNVQNDRMQLGNDFLGARRYDVVLLNPNSNTAVAITTDVQGNLLTVRIPSQGVDIVRADLASVTVRTHVHSNPGDEPVTIPSAAGFNIGATLTRPPKAAPGDASADRDPPRWIQRQRSGRLSGRHPRDWPARRSDRQRRLHGRSLRQARVRSSGGRSESATLTDYADDVRTVMRWLSERKDVDPEAHRGRRPQRRRVGGASRGVARAAVRGGGDARQPGHDRRGLVLELQQRTLDLLTLSPEERRKREALQKQIIAAVQSSKGLTDLPTDIRRRADAVVPKRVELLAGQGVEDVRQPLLILHAGLDHEVEPADADRLAKSPRRKAIHRPLSS